VGGHVARMEDMRNAKFWSENLNGGDHLEDMSVNKKKG
jgi:hypothetical protein